MQASLEKGLGDMRHTTYWISKESVHITKMKLCVMLGEPGPPATEAPSPLLHYLILAGLYIFDLRMQMCKVGITLANESLSLSHCSRLYNSLQQEKLLTAPWPDMEVVLSLLRDSNI